MRRGRHKMNPAKIYFIVFGILTIAAQFGPKFVRTGRVMPAGMMSILSVLGIIVAIVAWAKK